jgi:hypothetical protein
MRDAPNQPLHPTAAAFRFFTVQSFTSRRGRSNGVVRRLGGTLKALATTVLAVALVGCAATGASYSPADAPAPTVAKLVVYRTSQIGGTAGTWVFTRLEVYGMPTRKLPADSFVELEVPVGDISLSATDLVNIYYDDKNRMTLSESVSGGEIAYFRILSVYGGCEAIYEKVESSVIAHATHYPRPDWPQTTCFQRVPEAVALKELENLRRGN